jgi:hypothetical protein
MSYACGYSTKESPKEAVCHVKEQLTGVDPGLVVFFASSSYDPSAIAAGMHETFGPAPTVGCTTAGEIVSGKMLSKSLVAMAFDREAIGEVAVETLEGVSEDARSEVERAFEGFGNHFDRDPAAMEHDRFLGLVMVDGLSRAEERLMDAVGDATNVVFVGGSAGDDVRFEKTHVFHDGRASSDSAVLALLKPNAAFGVLKTQSFRDTGKRLVVTRADEPTRTAIELNGRPAARAYAEAVGCAVGEVSSYFMRMPVGLMIEGEPFVRSPQQVQREEIVFYCEIKEGMELALLESKDIVADTRRDLEQAFASRGRPEAIINFHCILRTLELELEGRLEPYGRLFENVPTIGFSTYGEQYLGHINQTSTMVLLG